MLVNAKKLVHVKNVGECRRGYKIFVYKNIEEKGCTWDQCGFKINLSGRARATS